MINDDINTLFDSYADTDKKMKNYLVSYKKNIYGQIKYIVPSLILTITLLMQYIMFSKGKSITIVTIVGGIIAFIGYRLTLKFCQIDFALKLFKFKTTEYNKFIAAAYNKLAPFMLNTNIYNFFADTANGVSISMAKDGGTIIVTKKTNLKDKIEKYLDAAKIEYNLGVNEKNGTLVIRLHKIAMYPNIVFNNITKEKETFLHNYKIISNIYEMTMGDENEKRE